MTIEYVDFKDRKLFFLSILLIVIAIKAFLISLFIHFSPLGLGPDEAQYWTWSQALDWGYYSKPPGVAWQIWLGTQVFGDTELGVRFASILFSMGQAIGVYFLAIKCDLNSRNAFWCGLIMALSPIGLIGSILAITDNGLLFFWILACLATAYALKNKKPVNSLLLGLIIGCGALFKWPIYLFWGFYLIVRHFYFSNESWRNVICGVLISLIGLLPSLWWNFNHDWATFRHVSSTIQGGHAPNPQGNLLEFIGSQILLLSPILFIIFLVAAYTWIQKYKKLSPQIFFCGLVAFSSLGLASLASYFQKIQGNWVIFAYPTVIIVIGWYCFEKQELKWAKRGIVLSILLTTSILFLSLPNSFYSFPNKMNSFKHNLGWNDLHAILEKQGYQKDKHFLASDKYQTTSILSFYNKEKKRAYFLNLWGARNNQFSYWPSLYQEQRGKEGFFVAVENLSNKEKEFLEERKISYEDKLKNYFESIEYVGAFPFAYHNNSNSKYLIIFKCKECKNNIINNYLY